MKALSLTQPWATLVAIDAKQFETRSWSTSYRGPLAIHAAKGFPADCRQLCSGSPFYEALAAQPGMSDPLHACLPRGAILAVAELNYIVRTEEMMRLWQQHRGASDVWNWHDKREYDFGDYSEDRFAWRLIHVRRLVEPVPCRGALGLWNVPPDVEAQFRFTEAA